MSEPWLIERLSIQHRRLNVFVPRRDVMGDDGKVFPISHSNVGFGEDGAAVLVHRTTGTHRIEPHGAEHIPGRGFSPVVIARDAHRSVVVPEIHHLSYAALRFPRLTREIVEVRDMETRLIAL